MNLHLGFLRLLVGVSLSLTAHSAHSADKKKTKAKPKAEAGTPATTSAATAAAKKMRPYKIVYGSASWNLDSTKLDQAYMFVREKKSGKIAKLLLEETASDSSIFSGTFSLDFKNDTGASLEAYVFDESARYDEKQLAKVNETIQSGKVSPSPVVNREENGLRVIDVYDTKEQAKRAREVYENQLAQKNLAAMPTKVKKQTTTGQVDANIQAEKAAMVQKLALESATRETMRIRMEQLEAQRLKKLAEEHAALNAQAKEKQQRSAQEWAQKGDAAYAKNDYATSEAAYAKAVELDPTNKTPYFKYGVSLYRNGKLNEAAVALKLSTTENAEKSYYMGLIHYRLKELPKSLEYFTTVKNSKDSDLSPSAVFYIGVIQFSLDNYDEAKSSFEWVLDNSKEPALDKQAEEYIERIAAAIEVKKEAARKWKLNASGGVTSDSNILYATDSETTQGSAFDSGGIRYLLTGDVEYRFSYKLESELAGRFSTTYLYSADSDFAEADPFILTAALPYTRKGIHKGKSYRAVYTPGYEKIKMDVNTDDTREDILNTIFVSADYTFVERSDYYAGYTIEIRQEDSLLTSSTGDEDQDATKLTLKTQHTFLTGTDKKAAVMGLGGLVWNQAKGDNKQFHRIDIGAIYSAPWKKYTNTTWNTGLTAYKLDYFNSDDGRDDMNFTYILGMAKVLNPRWTWSLNGTYSNNTSTENDNQYSKYTATLLATYNWAK